MLLALLCAFSFGAIVKVALADHFHTTCVGHGFVHGTDTNDGSFHSRVENGCGSSTRTCYLYVGGAFGGGVSTSGDVTCNAWSRDYSQNYSECRSLAQVTFSGVFSTHNHLAHNWCG